MLTRCASRGFRGFSRNFNAASTPPVPRTLARALYSKGDDRHLWRMILSENSLRKILVLLVARSHTVWGMNNKTHRGNQTKGEEKRQAKPTESSGDA